AGTGPKVLPDQPGATMRCHCMQPTWFPLSRCQNVENAPSRLAVPQLRDTFSADGCPEQALDGGNDSLRIEPNKEVGTLLDRYRPLRVVPESQARDTQHSSLFLDSARVG